MSPKESQENRNDRAISCEEQLLYLVMNNARYAKKLILNQLDSNKKGLPLNLLANIGAKGNTLADLCQRLQCSKQEATRLVQQAKEKNWVDIHASEEDKRSKVVSLSGEGKAVLEQGIDVYQALESELLKELTEDEKMLMKQHALLLNRLLKQQLSE
jgi:DNA-binding MarR family transcriptional regulator